MNNDDDSDCDYDYETMSERLIREESRLYRQRANYLARDCALQISYHGDYTREWRRRKTNEDSYRSRELRTSYPLVRGGFKSNLLNLRECVKEMKATEHKWDETVIQATIQDLNNVERQVKKNRTDQKIMEQMRQMHIKRNVICVLFIIIYWLIILNHKK